MKDKQRIAYLVIYRYIRRQKIIDCIIDMFIRISKNMIHRSEKRMIKKLISQIKKVYGRDTISFNIDDNSMHKSYESAHVKYSFWTFFLIF